MSKSFLKQSLQGFEPYVPGEQPPDDAGWVKLNTNESALPPSPRVIEAIRNATGDALRLYPSSTAAPARQAIARRFDLEPAQVMVGNGADELIEMCFRAFAGAGDRVAFPTPTYPVLEPLCLMHETPASMHPTELPWELPPTLAADPAHLKFIANPNSPTGALFSAEAVEEVVEGSLGVVVIDEAYVDFAPRSSLPLLASHPNVLLLRTFSKSYALAGLRIGFALGNPDLIAALDLVKESYNVDRLATAAAVAAIEDETHHRMIVDQVIANRGALNDALLDLGFEIVPSAANFLFVKPPRPAGEVAAGLREQKILVRHYDREPIAGWFRVTIGTKEQHERLLAALRGILR